MNQSGTTIYIGNLNYAVDEEALREKFSIFGKVEWIKVILKPDGKKSGIAFIHMPNSNQAKTAIHKLNATEWMGRTIKVSVAEERFDKHKHYNRSHKQEREEKDEKIETFKPVEKPKKKYGLQVLFDHLNKNLKK